MVYTDTAHINADECHALKRLSGVRIINVKNRNGKTIKEDVKGLLDSRVDEHSSKARIISISQTTEIGTLYSIKGIKELAYFAHENNMLLHVDSARIANAIVVLKASYKEMITYNGVDITSRYR